MLWTWNTDLNTQRRWSTWMPAFPWGSSVLAGTTVFCEVQSLNVTPQRGDVLSPSHTHPHYCDWLTIRVLRPHPPLVIRQTGIIISGNGGVGTLQLWSTRTILSVKMDRENSLTLLWPQWGSNPVPSDPQSEPPIDCATGSGTTLLEQNPGK
jgi:hypothetical protein